MNPLLGRWQFSSFKVDLLADPQIGLYATFGKFSYRVEVEGFPSIPYERLVQIPFQHSFYPTISRLDNREFRVQLLPRGAGGCWDWLCGPASDPKEQPVKEPLLRAAPSEAEQFVPELSFEAITREASSQAINPAECDMKLQGVIERSQKTFSEVEPLYVPLFASSGGTKSVELEKQFFSFLQGPQKTLLVIGSSGSGKTVFCHAMVDRMARQDLEYTPLMIPLTSLKHPVAHLMVEFFTSQGLTPAEIVHLKNRKFVLFLDGFDELQIWRNLYVSNNLHEWNVKVVFTCRPEYLDDVRGNLDLFAPHEGPTPSLALLQYLYITPFSDEQIRVYLEKYVKTGNSMWKDVNVYHEAFRKTPSLKELITNPFTLKIVTEVFPSIFEEYSKEHGDEQLQLTRLKLYRAFVDGWLKRQAEKSHCSAKDLLDFCKKLAMKMHKKKIFQVKYKPGGDLFSSEQDEWKPFFGTDDPSINILRSGAPLIQVETDEWGFLHPSLRDFFFSETIFITGKTSMPAPADPVEKVIVQLNERLLISESGIMCFLSDFYNATGERQKCLLEIILRSRENSKIAIAAANAMTLLNMGGFSFHNRDLSGIRIPGADLSGGIFDLTNFTGADLRKVKFARACFNHTILDRAQMDEVQFGHWPSFPHKKEVTHVQFLPKGRLATSTNGGILRFWDLQKGEETKRVIFKEPDQKGEEDMFPQLSKAKFSKDGTIAVEILENAVAFESFKSSGRPNRIQHKMKMRMLDTCFSSDGLVVAVGGTGGTLSVFNPANGQLLHSLNSLPEARAGVAAPNSGENFNDRVLFSHNGRYLFASGSSNVITMWDWKANKSVVVLKRHTSHIEALAIHPSGQWLISAGKNVSELFLWDLSRPGECQIIDKIGVSVSALAFSPSGRLLAIGAGNDVSLWDFKTMEQLRSFREHKGKITALSFSDDERLLASGAEDATAMIWNIDFQTLRKTEVSFPPMEHTVAGAVGDQMVSMSDDGKIVLWDPRTKKMVKTFEGLATPTSSFRTSSDGKLLAILPITVARGRSRGPKERKRKASKEKEPCTLRVWNTEQQQVVFTCNSDYPILDCAFSSDGKQMVLSFAYESNNQTISRLNLIDMQTRQQVTSALIDGGLIDTLVFSPDNRSIVVASSYGGESFLWTLNSSALTQVIKKPHIDDIAGMMFLDPTTFCIAGIPKNEKNTAIQLYDLEVNWKAFNPLPEDFFTSDRLPGVSAIAFSPKNYLMAYSAHPYADHALIFNPNYQAYCRHFFVGRVELGRAPFIGRAQIPGHSEAVEAFCFSSSGEFLISTDTRKTVFIWKLYDESLELKPTLYWRSSDSFYCLDVSLKGAKLSPLNRRLLENSSFKYAEPKIMVARDPEF